MENKNIIKALVKFQSLLEQPNLDSKAYNYKYSTLANVLNSIKEPLKESELVATQYLSTTDKTVSVHTVISHISGEFIESHFAIPIDFSQKNIAQEIGKVSTYAKRYAINAMLCISPHDDDNDANMKKETRVDRAIKVLKTKYKLSDDDIANHLIKLTQ